MPSRCGGVRLCQARAPRVVLRVTGDRCAHSRRAAAYHPAVFTETVVVAGRDVAAFGTWAMACGWWHRRVPAEQLRADGFLLRLRTFEARGRWYEERLRIKRWKDRLPETGHRGGGMSKKALPGRSAHALRRFEAECIRGERTHWSIAAGGPFFAIWNTTDWALCMTFLGAVGNAPFIAILRYNRARISAMPLRSGAIAPRTT
jgi:glycosyl-4,4'-diaponeurosporenoate acyltransferase